MVVAAADGPAAELLDGASAPVEKSLAAEAMRRQEIVAVADMSSEIGVMEEARAAGFGPGLYVPMEAAEGAIGSLVLARVRGEEPFTAVEQTAAQVFASAAAIVLALGSTRRALERMRLTAEHERIARDLHDTVIQRLFGLGVGLQVAEGMAEEPVAERIRSTVDGIDEVIREIRETIFDLNRPEGMEDSSLRLRFRDLVREASEALGFLPRVAFRGPVDSAVPDQMVAPLLAVLRESLSNVGRHAKASTADVVLSVSDGWVTLNVADDGIGITGEPAAGHGLANLEARAAELGGDFSVARRRPAGTLVHWRAPIRRGS
jgi:signal transduction histidine kinase